MSKSGVPKISIITPSYNQSKYLEDTIQSVIGQNYPALEYIIIDGGSTDNSVEIIKKYEGYISYWESRKDKGQANAINRGFSIATGDIIAWLNSDDFYLPGTLNYISRVFGQESDLKIVFGNCFHLDEDKKRAYGSDVRFSQENRDIEFGDYIIQPSSFWNKRTFETVGELDESLTYAFDWEWFIRAKRKSVVFCPVDRFLSTYRIHSEHKTHTGGLTRTRELASVYRRFHSEQLASSYLKWKTDSTVAQTNKFIVKLRLNRLIDKQKLLYLLFFRQISFKEFESIIGM
jgi:glycosyltransferase involved in cell wall biosynthesis